MPQPPFNLLLIDDYRANKGQLTLSLGEMSLKDAKMLLLNTTGARTSEPRTAPMGYWLDGDAGGNGGNGGNGMVSLYVMGIDRGSPKHPQWYWNLRATPTATVELGAETYEAKAMFVEDDIERERLISAFGKQMPPMEVIVRGMKRRVPIIRLDRA